MSSRLHFTLDLLKNGTHLLITDVDNVFSRYVPLVGFLDEGYDAYHAFEMHYPKNIKDEFGFVVCSGHQFIRSSPEAIKFTKLVIRRCNAPNCDDQVVYNTVFFNDLKISGTTTCTRTTTRRCESIQPTSRMEIFWWRA